MGPDGGGFPLLVAPMGASAVLVFVVPASPLAQPWSVIGGNMLSAAVGLAVGHAVGQALGAPVLAGAIAVGTAIAAMALARCLHPPGGACALLCALGAAGPEAWGWTYLWPIALNVAAMAGAGWLYNNLTGHPWPHRAAVPAGPPHPRRRWIIPTPTSKPCSPNGPRCWMSTWTIWTRSTARCNAMWRAGAGSGSDSQRRKLMKSRISAAMSTSQQLSIPSKPGELFASQIL